MIEFHGKPFLEYLIELLRDQGFDRVLLLLGYLPDVVSDHFGDGTAWDIQIDYSITGPDDLTVHRLREASHLLDEQFLLAYCDNYWPLRVDRLWGRLMESGCEAVVTVYANEDGYSKGCVRVDREGIVETYDRSRTAPGLQGVEIGFGIFARSMLALLPEEDAMIEDALYPRLVERRQLAANLTNHRYYSVGSPERLPLTDEFLARRPAILLDRDGVLNERPARARYVRSWNDFRWLPGALEALRVLAEAGWRVVVVSNQAGVARGELTEDLLAEIHARMRNEARRAGGRIDAVYHCPHGWDDGCDCRKPRPGMLFQAQRDFQLDLSRVTFVGDDERDREAADAAGCGSVLVSTDRPLRDVVRSLVASSVRTPSPLAVPS
jgi:D-glycero-D-manno-heptose 1,7-bisphosphate phosphatase